MLNLDKIRKDFPILSRKVNGNQLVYLDNAATTQKPKPVLDQIVKFYTSVNSNVHRGMHHLSKQASLLYEQARKTVQEFINAKDSKEIIFTNSATGAINLVADSFGDAFIKQGDEIIVTEMEHHSNIIPWQKICRKKGASLKVLPITEQETLNLNKLKELINKKTKLISITYISNVLGIVNPVKKIIDLAHIHNVCVLVDGAQAIQHLPVDVQKLDCDFFVFSGHKIYAETGIGVLYGKEKWLNEMPPYQSGGGMIESVKFDKTNYAKLPLKFEAGTGNFAAAISLKASLDYLNNLNKNKIFSYERRLMDYALEKLKSIDGLTIYGKSTKRYGAISFNLYNIHPYDLGVILDQLGIAVRTGTHCAEPLMAYYKVKGTIRASFSFYNTKKEVDQLAEGIQKAQTILLASSIS
ncbi:MAG: cysteine desulfurase [Candidatus Omnitrophica bacterium]|nr:cysteine desulfurase [Candidatus Omnitrophota bacterium]MCF7892449.1 cysteine desulfurase [Candidatus Omnitrophota bacterium]MCF7895448.1 cysteine desulfurase [Candidatus Omnitrophota bacterium]MCF7897828.1 cysteine desulfurase [Candidatus Omnitrophota bacterium]MCF7909734.1 cysteine desulfurase [Candidatus Omnitrophota bacterium]